MVKITFDLNEETDAKFRRLVAEKKGLHRGVIAQSLEEAIEAWIIDQAKKKRDEK